MRANDSKLNNDIVVKPPKIPVIQNRFHPGDNGSKETYPIAALPTQLATNVARGSPHKLSGIKVANRARNKAPSAPPIMTSFNSKPPLKRKADSSESAFSLIKRLLIHRSHRGIRCLEHLLLLCRHRLRLMYLILLIKMCYLDMLACILCLQFALHKEPLYLSKQL